MINIIKISNRKTQKKSDWLSLVLKPASCLQHWLVSDAVDKSSRNCIVACYELTCPGERFLPDPHQLAVDGGAKAYIATHPHVFLSIYTTSMWQNAKSDSWYFHLQESRSEERIFLTARGSRSTWLGEGKAAEIRSLMGNCFYKQHLKYAPLEGVWRILTTCLRSISSLWVALTIELSKYSHMWKYLWSVQWGRFHVRHSLFLKVRGHRNTGLEWSRPGWPFCITPDSRFLHFCSFLLQAPETPHGRDYAPDRSASTLPALWQCFLINFNVFGSKLSLCFPILPTTYRQQIVPLAWTTVFLFENCCFVS